MGRRGRTPAFGIAVLAPVLLAGAVAASPGRPPAPAAVAVASSPAPSTAGPGQVVRPPAGIRIPAKALSAYRKAEQTMATTAPGCGLSWNLLAGIARIEASPATAGAPAVRSVSARTAGPKKPPSATWSRFASDGDGDGKSDPRNPFDAALATARHLCSSGLNLHNQAQVLTGLLRYNNSLAFAHNVLGWAEAYATGSAPLNLPPIFGPVPVLGPNLPAGPCCGTFAGEPQQPLVLGTSSQAGRMLPEPSVPTGPPPAESTPPPADVPAPTPWEESPSTVLDTAPGYVPPPPVLPLAVEPPAQVGNRTSQPDGPQWNGPQPQLPAVEPVQSPDPNLGGSGGGRDNSASQDPGQSTGGDDGGGQKSGGARRGAKSRG